MRKTKKKADFSAILLALAGNEGVKRRGFCGVAGFRVVDRACCGIGRNQAEITCLPLATPCANRSEYVFWDAFHPSEAVNAILAQRALDGPPSDCFPVNLRQLALLPS